MNVLLSGTPCPPQRLGGLPAAGVVAVGGGGPPTLGDASRGDVVVKCGIWIQGGGRQIVRSGEFENYESSHTNGTPHALTLFFWKPLLFYGGTKLWRNRLWWYQMGGDDSWQGARHVGWRSLDPWIQETSYQEVARGRGRLTSLGPSSSPSSSTCRVGEAAVRPGTGHGPSNIAEERGGGRCLWIGRSFKTKNEIRENLRRRRGVYPSHSFNQMARAQNENPLRCQNVDIMSPCRQNSSPEITWL